MNQENVKMIVSQEACIEIEEEGEEECCKSIAAEKAARCWFVILSEDGSEESPDIVLRNRRGRNNFSDFVRYEVAKDRSVKEAPPHIALMKQLELVQFVEGADSGNFCFAPRGVLVKSIIEQLVVKNLLDYGAHQVQSPNFYDYEHPALRSYMERFPARQYKVMSGEKPFFLRFSACFGQFLFLSQSVISYKALPVKCFEIAQSYRREQAGETAGLRRLRGFSMPDMHSLCSDMPMAQSCFKEQYELSLKMMKDLDLDFEVAFRVQKDFYEANKEWIVDMIKLSGRKKALLELFEERYAYFILKFEFNFVDSQGKAAALATVQIDVENAERFNVKFFSPSGEKQHPLILHCSISGSVERCIYALLEKEAMNISKQEKGDKDKNNKYLPCLPFFLSPCHVRLVPVSLLQEEQMDYCRHLQQKMQSRGIRVEIDDRDISLKKKIVSSDKMWVPYLLVIGKKEIDSKKLIVRSRCDNNEKEEIEEEEFVEMVSGKLQGYPQLQLPLPSLLSQQVIFSRLL